MRISRCSRTNREREREREIGREIGRGRKKKENPDMKI